MLPHRFELSMDAIDDFGDVLGGIMTGPRVL
jgi:hypothetical protein